MSKECYLVKDLLPLYVEDMVSEETALFIEEHFQTCSNCKALFDSMKESNSAVMNSDKDSTIDAVKIIKKINSKWLKKVLLIMISTILLTVGSLFAFWMLEPYFYSTIIDYGESEIYSDQDKEDAVEVIIEKFNQFEGCVLYEVSYTSDSYCLKNLDYVNDLAPEGVVFSECIVFDTEFRSPIFGGGAWNPNRIYEWSWYLGRTEGGNWQLLTWGVG